MTPLSFDYPISVAILYIIDAEGTQKTAYAIRDALESRGHTVNMVRVTKTNWRKAMRTSGDVVFNLVEDQGWQLYTKVGRYLENLGRAQVGHDLKTFAFAVDKSAIKRRLTAHGLSTPQYRILPARFKSAHIRGLEYPLIVKPTGEHASEGISQDSVVIDEQELFDRAKFLGNRYGREILVEEFIEGDEFHVTVMGNGQHLVVLPYIGIDYAGEYADNWNVFTYNAKWDHSSWEYNNSVVYCPAVAGKILEKRIDALVKRACKVLGCIDIVRFDLRIDEHLKPYILDVNANPSTSNDINDECWRSVMTMGWNYPQFIETLIAITYKRVYGRLPDRVRERHLLLHSGLA